MYYVVKSNENNIEPNESKIRGVFKIMNNRMNKEMIELIEFISFEGEWVIIEELVEGPEGYEDELIEQIVDDGYCPEGTIERLFYCDEHIIIFSHDEEELPTGVYDYIAGRLYDVKESDYE